MANVRGASTSDADCRCVYVDQRLSQDLNGLQVEGTDSAGFRTAASSAGNPGYDLTLTIDKQIEELKHNITALLNEFEQSKSGTERLRILSRPLRLIVL